MVEGTVKIALVIGVLSVVTAHALSHRTASLRAAATPLATAPASTFRPALPPGPVELASDRAGHFSAPVEIDGRRVSMLVDTGASYVSLTAQDAGRLGIMPTPADFRLRMTTANGTAYAAPVNLREVFVGSIVVRDVPAIVMTPGASDMSLLGMSFLKRLRGYEVTDGHLVLKP